MCLKSNAFGLVEGWFHSPLFPSVVLLQKKMLERHWNVCSQRKITESITEKDKAIVELTDERDTMKARIAELEALVPSDNKNLPAADSKELPAGDAKDVTVVDDKTVSVEDEKKTGKGKASK